LKEKRRIEVPGRRGRRCNQQLDDYGNERVTETEIINARPHSVEKWL